MNYIIISEFGTVYGWGSCPDDAVEHIDPPDGRIIVPNVNPPQSQDTYWRYTDGSLTDTGQPITPPSQGLTWDDQTGFWVDARTIDQLKAAKWEEVKLARSNAEYGGFVWDGSPFDSDAASQQRIIGASQLASLNPSVFEIDWTLADNTVRTLNAAEMNSVGIALGQHVNAQYVHARDLRQQIADATTKEDVQAVVW